MKILIVISLLLASFSAVAKVANVTLQIPSMNCLGCPITVGKSLQKVAGVIKVKVIYEQRLAHIRFDDEITNVKALIAATDNAGYPSFVKEVTL